jgi:predicted nucleic acid-binding protein
VTTLVDTNVLLDIATDDPRWAVWSLHQLDAAAIRGPVVINPVVYAEFSIGYARIEEIDQLLADAGLKLAEIPRAALFLAGKVFQAYRAQGGNRTGVLPDFFIGAHALVDEFPLLTRDARRYRTYFPNIVLIAPDQSGIALVPRFRSS